MFKHCDNQNDKKLIFSSLTKDVIDKVFAFFAQEPTKSKYSRKQSNLPFSFIKSGNFYAREYEGHSIVGKASHSIFAISNDRLGTGTYGEVKVAQNIITKEIVISKMQLLNSGYNNFLNEVVVLKQLNQLHATAIRTKDFKRAIGGWKKKNKEKSTTSSASGTCIFDVKFYIFSDFFYGITLYKYISCCNPTIKQILIIIILVLEKLIEFQKFFIHGDLSIFNILINEFLDQRGLKQQEINFIDFGWSGSLSNGIKICHVAGEFSTDNYFPPECYSKQAKEIILECKEDPYFSEDLFIIHTISKWAEKYDCGFQTITSDVYNFMWGMFNYSQLKNTSILDQCPILRDNKTLILSSNPFLRLNSTVIISNCKEQLFNLNSLLPSSPTTSALLFSARIKKIQSTGDLSSSSNGLSRDNLDEFNMLDKSDDLTTSSTTIEKFNAFKLKPNS